MSGRDDKQKAKKPAAWPYGHVTAMTADLGRNQWVKRIRGRRVSFGVLSDPEAALAKYQAHGPALHAGLSPAQAPAGASQITVGELCLEFLDHKKSAIDRKALSRQTYRDYESTARKVLERFGAGRLVAALRPTDFSRLVDGLPYGPTRRRNFATWCRHLFAWGYDQELCDLPRFGRALRSDASMKRHAREMAIARGRNLFTAAELGRILDTAGRPLEAMTWLAINGGLGPADVAELELDAIDVNRRSPVLDYPRPKTLIERRVPLWPETVRAVADVLTNRSPYSTPAGRDRLFLTRSGRPWASGSSNALPRQFSGLLEKAGVKRGRRHRLGFYSIRHTFRTVADAAGDQHATARIMGHALPGMADVYVEKISEARLRAVAEHVRSWLSDR